LLRTVTAKTQSISAVWVFLLAPTKAVLLSVIPLFQMPTGKRTVYQNPKAMDYVSFTNVPLAMFLVRWNVPLFEHQQVPKSIKRAVIFIHDPTRQRLQRKLSNASKTLLMSTVRQNRYKSCWAHLLERQQDQSILH